MSNHDTDYLDQKDVELAALAEENRRLRDALKHYQHGWDRTGYECSKTGSAIYVKWSKYGGDIATKALKGAEE